MFSKEGEDLTKRIKQRMAESNTWILQSVIEIISQQTVVLQEGFKKRQSELQRMMKIQSCKFDSILRAHQGDYYPEL